MDFKEWEPVYESILKDMGFSRKDDEQAALILSSMLRDRGHADIADLRKIIDGKDVLICGNAPVLKDELEIVDPTELVVIAADGATTTLVDNGIIPDIIVTDLDGDVDTEISASQHGSLMVVHAHGDNIYRLKRYVPRLKVIIGTTQAGPLDNVFNFGGFTDGDRCVYLAKEFNAASMTLIGFDLDDEDVTPLKKKKLKWARYLISKVVP